MSDDPRTCPIVWGPLAIGLALIGGCEGPPPTVAPAVFLKGHEKEVVSLAFSPDGKSLASRSSDAVKLWDVEGQTERKSLPSDGSSFAAVTFAPDGKTLAENRAGAGVMTWDVPSGDPRTFHRSPPLPEGFAGDSVTYGWGLAYSPDGKTLAGGGSHQGADGYVTLWDTSGGEGSNLGSYGSPVSTVAYAPDGRTLAAGGMDGSVDLWDTATRRVRNRLAASRAYLAPVAFSPDGLTLATASEDRKIRLWDVATGTDRGVLKGHLKGVFGVAYHPGGRFLASSDAGGTIFLWNLASRQAVARLEGHRGKVWAVAFAPGGRFLASGGEDRTVRLWDVSGSTQSGGR